MSTGTIVAIVIIAVVVLAVIAFAMPRMRAGRQERQLGQARGRAAEGHRELAEERMQRARLAESQAQRERAEAELHQSRADMHEQGLADDELDGAPAPGRFEREPEPERDDVAERERTS
jgi:flagellar biosynthesis/type III secretory pathway M-ring protein FliF/YscJ